jgi:hypothetical protein
MKCVFNSLAKGIRLKEFQVQVGTILIGIGRFETSIEKDHQVFTVVDT